MAGSVMPHIPESRIYYQLLKEQCEKYELYDMIEVTFCTKIKIKKQECDLTQMKEEKL